MALEVREEGLDVLAAAVDLEVGVGLGDGAQGSGAAGVGGVVDLCVGTVETYDCGGSPQAGGNVGVVRVGAENCVVAGQAAFRYSLMSPPQRAVLTTSRCPSGWSAASVATGGR